MCAQVNVYRWKKNETQGKFSFAFMRFKPSVAFLMRIDGERGKEKESEKRRDTEKSKREK